MNFLKDLWDRFLLYLPLALMAVLALGTYWLVRTAPESTGAAVTPSAKP
jgi:lipopolysaccharide export system protein LptC